MGALAFGSGAEVGVVAADALVVDEADDATGRVLLLGKEDDVGEGLPRDIKDGFLEADEADLSARGRGVVEVGVGLADPVYPDEGRSARRAVLVAGSVGFPEPFAVGVVRGAF